MAHRPHRRGLGAVAWSPDGTRLATAGGDGTARIWDPTTGSLLTELTGHTGGVWALTWSPEGDRLVTAAADDTVRIWNPSTGTAAPTADSDVITAAAWSPGGTCLAAGRSSGTVQLWYPGEGTPTGIPGCPYQRDPRGGLVTRRPSPRDRGVRPHGRALASRVRPWPRETQEPHQCSSRRRLVPGRHSSRHRQRREDPALETRRQPMARPYRCTDRRHPRRPLPLDIAAAWSPDGTRIATGGHNCTVRLWEPGSWTTTATLTGHSAPVHAVAWSPDGTRLASTGADRTLRLWEPRSGNPVVDQAAPATPPRSTPWTGPPTAPTSPPLTAPAS